MVPAVRRLGAAGWTLGYGGGAAMNVAMWLCCKYEQRTECIKAKCLNKQIQYCQLPSQALIVDWL